MEAYCQHQNCPTLSNGQRQKQTGFVLQLLIKTGKQVWKILTLWSQRSKQRGDLQNLNDHLLKDIGLTRADVNGVSRHSLGLDKRRW